MLSAIVTPDYLLAQSVQRGFGDSNLKTLIYKTDFSITDHYDFVYHEGFFVLLQRPTEQHVNFCAHLRSLTPGKNIFVLIYDCEIEILNMLKEVVGMPLFFAPFSYRKISNLFEKSFSLDLDDPLFVSSEGLRLRLDPGTRELYVNEEVSVQLKNKEYYIMKFLFCNKGKLVSKTDMFEFVWGKSLLSSMDTVDVHMSKLRNKLRTHIPFPVIKTVPCAGYILE